MQSTDNVTKGLKQRLTGLGRRLSGADAAAPTVEYAYPTFSIRMPVDHKLGHYQRQHKLYDRFLPHLARYLPEGGTVVDIGANCGDTLAAMVSENPRLNYVCIEPDDRFFGLLEENTHRIRAVEPGLSVRLVKSLIGKAVTNVSLEGSDGTKKAVVGSDSDGLLRSTALDQVLTGAEAAGLVLLKSDVDGFDFDVIDSAEALIDSRNPMLFFECQLDHDFQKIGYEKTITKLFHRGYVHWVVFDNFGEVVLRTGSAEDVLQLLGYVWRQNMKRTSRTIHYFDVLGSGMRHRNVVNECVRDYFALL